MPYFKGKFHLLVLFFLQDDVSENSVSCLSFWPVSCLGPLIGCLLELVFSLFGFLFHGAPVFLLFILVVHILQWFQQLKKWRHGEGRGGDSAPFLCLLSQTAQAAWSPVVEESWASEREMEGLLGSFSLGDR